MSGDGDQRNGDSGGGGGGTPVALLSPGQGAQAVGMGRAWAEASPAARAVLERADAILAAGMPDGPWADAGAPSLTSTCFEGPADRLDRTDVSQPAIFACSIASLEGLRATDPDGAGAWDVVAAAGLSLGEYTALHLGGVFDFETALRLVARRGALMQRAAEARDGGMVALIGADEGQARTICERAAGEVGDRAGEVLVPANFNAPGQIVLSGSKAACDRAVALAGEAGVRAQPLSVAGAFHSPLMQPAADGLAEALADLDLGLPSFPVWSNVTGRPHDPENAELIRERLVQQLTHPVRWDACCASLVEAIRAPGPMGAAATPAPARVVETGKSAGGAGRMDQSGDSASSGSSAEVELHELAPGSVLRGLMRRIERTAKVTSHDQP